MQHDTTDDSNIKFLTNSDKVNTYLKSEVDVFLSILQAGVDRRVLIRAVQFNGKFKLNATSYAILTTQKVDGSTVHDALYISYGSVDTASKLTTFDIDCLSQLNLKASASNVYAKSEISDKCIIYIHSLNTKADKTNTYLKTDIDVFYLLYNLVQIDEF